MWKSDSNWHAIDAGCQELAESMRQQGYYMIDRTICATISLGKHKDFSKFCRMPVERLESPVDRVYEIAMQSFLMDSRFFKTACPAEKDIREEIRACVDGMGAVYVCRCRDAIAGFLEIVPGNEAPIQQSVVRLAAVDKMYRTAGVALSMYAGVAELCRKQGIRKLQGRISTRNMSVMNLYAALGASFSIPKDVYVRR